MSEPATFGGLMEAASDRHDYAQLRIHTSRFVDEAAARATVAARAVMLRALLEQVHSMGEFPTLTDLHAYDVTPGQVYGLARPPKTLRTNHWSDGAIARGVTTLPPTTTAVERWSAVVTAEINRAPKDDGSPSPTADRYREATQLIRAATDLISTHRAIDSLPARSPDYGASRPALELAASASQGNHFLVTRAYQAGVRVDEINTWMPHGAAAQLHDASQVLLSVTAPTPAGLATLRLAGTVRSATPAHEWADRVERVHDRLDHLASAPEVDLRTMHYAAAVGLLNDQLSGATDAAQWRAVAVQLRTWKGIHPPDSGITADLHRLRAIAKQAAREPRTEQTQDIVDAAHASRPIVDGMARSANRIMPSVRRWLPTNRKPTPSYLREVKAGPNLTRFEPNTEPALLWPTTAPVLLDATADAVPAVAVRPPLRWRSADPASQQLAPIAPPPPAITL